MSYRGALNNAPQRRYLTELWYGLRVKGKEKYIFGNVILRDENKGNDG